jgi:hypothetical protein
MRAIPALAYELHALDIVEVRMPRVRLVALCCALAFMTVTGRVGLHAQSDRIIGFTTAGGIANTTLLVIRRPPIRGGKITTAGSQFASTGSSTETGSAGGTYAYTVTIKADGGWSASSKTMTEDLLLTIANYKGAPVNGTWRYKSTGSCAQDPWRFPVTCTGVQHSVTRQPSGDVQALKTAVPFPLSAAGRLSGAEADAIALAEVVEPQANQALGNPASVVVKVQVHDATMSDKAGKLLVDIRPYGSPDFPSAATAKDYVSKSFPSYIGSPTQMTFDLSGHDKTEWQVSSRFDKVAAGARSPWVRFSTKPKVMSTPAILNIEGESLAATASGAVTVQPMQPFGPNWSGGAHLWWAGGAGATLTVTFDVAVARNYAAELYMTRAPDFGDAQITLGGLTPVLKFFGYSPKVLWSGPIQMGKFQLSPGKNTLRFYITGKNASSKGYALGFDRLRLYGT